MYYEWTGEYDGVLPDLHHDLDLVERNSTGWPEEGPPLEGAVVLRLGDRVTTDRVLVHAYLEPQDEETRQAVQAALEASEEPSGAPEGPEEPPGAPEGAEGGSEGTPGDPSESTEATPGPRRRRSTSTEE